MESKGLYNEESLTDSPIRGNRCTLRLRRREWKVLKDGILIKRDWNIVAQGTRTTNEIAYFYLKNIIDRTPISCKVIGEFFGVDGKQLQSQ